MLSTVRNICVFVGFINYYYYFIYRFSCIVLPLTTLTKKELGAA